MIFVTVGTTLPFDALVAAVDRLVGSLVIRESVVCQIGHGTYFPHNCEYFCFKPNVDQWVEDASLVIGHGGTGTVYSALCAGKPLIAVANPAAADDHQAQFLARLSHIASFLWTKDLEQIPALLEKVPSFKLQSAKVRHLAADVRMFLLGNR